MKSLYSKFKPGYYLPFSSVVEYMVSIFNMIPIIKNKYRIALFTVLLIFTQISELSTQERIPKGYFRPEFRDIEIQDFLKTMAQISKKNILIDESIKGKVTVISHRNIPVTQAADFMKQVLEARGFAVVEEPNLIKVLPQEKAGSRVMPSSEGDKSDPAGILTKVIRLPLSVNLNEMSGFLKGIVTAETKIAAYKDSNALVVTGYAPIIERVMALIEELSPTGDSGSGDLTNNTIHIYRVKNLQAESVAKILVKLDVPEGVAAEEAGSQDGKGAQIQQAIPKRTGGEAKIKAVSHPESNSIIVTATGAEWSEIKRIIEYLDQTRRQILLEVLVAEVSSSNLNDFGIDWRYQGADFGHSQFNSGLTSEGNLIDPTSGQVSGLNTLSGFSLGFLQQGGDLMAIFNANVSNQNFNVLSAPQVLTLDNQEAEINVGQDVPVQTQSRTSGGGDNSATVNSFEYRPSGIKLKFTPHVSAESRISLDLYSEVTNIEGGSTSNTNPTFNKRNIKTYVAVDNQQTIVIGGLVSSENLQAVKKLPWLGDIPFIGFLFRRTTLSVRKTNLMVFNTPHILDNREDSDRISRAKRDEQIRTSRDRYDDTKLWPERSAPRGPTGR